jgi:Family of unknown function (DUF6069)
MTATTALNTPATPASILHRQTGTRLWRTGVAASIAAAAAAFATAALAQAAGVSFAVAGKSIPLVGFAELTFVLSVVGTAIAAVLSHRARRPRHTFVVTTIGLTVVSFVPDVLADAHTATKLALALSHVVAAAIVIPALASRLTD